MTKMANEKRCETCTEECTKSQMAHEAAVGRMYATKEFISLQKKIESGQLVEVVRCEDCLFWESGENECESWEWCKILNTDMPPNGFCYLGDRKDEARNEL